MLELFSSASMRSAMVALALRKGEISVRARSSDAGLQRRQTRQTDHRVENLRLIGNGMKLSHDILLRWWAASLTVRPPGLRR
jgi:hypothetical protein